MERGLQKITHHSHLAEWSRRVEACQKSGQRISKSRRGNDPGNHPGAEVMLSDFKCSCPVYLVCGYTDLRWGKGYCTPPDASGLADLKKVYTTVTEDEALENLMAFKEKWGKQYPFCVKSWENNWDILSAFFAYPPEIWQIIYMTNIIEGPNRQFRQITKNKLSFTNDDSLWKMLYLASRKIVEHWTARCRNWDMVLAQLQIMFQNRQTA